MGEGGSSDVERVFLLAGIIERSFHEHSPDQLDSLLHQDLVVHGPVPLEQGAEGFKRSLASTRQAFPDMKITIQGGAVREPLVFRQWIMRGTHQGEFLGVAGTGRPIELHGVDIERLEDGRIVEHWTYWDRMSLMDQLGVDRLPVLG